MAPKVVCQHSFFTVFRRLMLPLDTLRGTRHLLFGPGSQRRFTQVSHLLDQAKFSGIGLGQFAGFVVNGGQQ